MRVISLGEKLPEYFLPLKSKEGATDLDIRDFLKRNAPKKRTLLRKLAGIPDAMEASTAKVLIKSFQKLDPDFKFTPEYAQSADYTKLVNTLIDYYFKSLNKKIKKAVVADLPLTDRQLIFPLQEMIFKSKALFRALDKMHFEPGKKEVKLSPDIRRLFIHASNQAQHTMFAADGALATGDLHEAISRFETITEMTPHYSLGLVDQFGKPLSAFMPVKTFELDWQNEFLKSVREVFSLDEKQSQSVVRYLGLFDEPDVRVEGFARTSGFKPNVNISPMIIDESIIPELQDPEVELMPMSTAVHEITHGLLKDRYPEFFNSSDEDKLKVRLADIAVNIKTPYGRYRFPIKDLEEMICFALTIFVNPVTTVRKLASINSKTKGIGNYGMAAIMGRNFLDKYQLGNPARLTDRVLSQVKLDALERAKHYIELLDKLKAQYVVS